MKKNIKQIYFSLIILSIFIFSNVSIPIIIGAQNPEGNPQFYPLASASFQEDFTTTEFMDDIATTAFGWGSGILTNERDFEWVARDHYLTSAPVIDIDVQGRKAYAAVYSSSASVESVTIFDINNIDDIQYLGGDNSWQYISSLAVEGDYLYSGHRETTVQDALVISDVADPISPAWQVGYGTDNFVTDIEIYGQLVFFTSYNVTNSKSLRFYNAENPTLLTKFETCDWDCNNSLGLDVEGGFAYVAASTEGFYILNMSNKYTPVEIGFLNTPGNATDVLVNGNLAYIADGESGIHIVNIQNRANPTILDSFDTPGYARRMVLQGNTLFVADKEGKVIILDVSNPNEILFVAEIEGLPTAYDVDLFGDILVVGAEDGIYTITIGAITNIGTASYPDVYQAPAIWDVRVENGIAYLACGLDGIHVVNVRNPHNPIFLSNYTFGASIDIRKIDIDGNFLYAVANNAYAIFDISNPNNIELVFATGGGNLSDIFIHGESLYISFDQGFAILNVSNHYIPSIIINHLPGIHNNNSAIWVQGTHVYMVEGTSAGTDTLSVYNVEDYTAPVLADSVNRATPMYDIQVDGDLAYLGAGGWFSIYNVSDPTAITYSGYEVTTSWGVSSFGRYVVSAERTYGVKLYDTTDVVTPNEIGHYPAARGAIQLTASGDYTYIANMSSLVILRHFRSAGDTYIDGVSTAQSTKISNEGERWITSATLTKMDLVIENTDITYFMSADGGLHWELVTPGTLHEFEFPGSELLWKAEMDGLNERTARLYAITIDYDFTSIPPMWWYIIGGAGGGLLLIIVIIAVIVRVSKKKRKIETR